MSMRSSYPRQALSFLFAVVVSIVAPANAAGVQAHLSIASGKTEFRSGEPIFLDLTFTSDAAVTEVMASDSSWPFSVDRVVLDRMQGVFPLYDDYVRGHPFASDGVMVQELEPNKTVAVRLALTDIYRFDQAGTYQVHVVTRRTGTELTTNDVAFSVRPFSEDEESELARSLEKRIREATDMADARVLAEQLDVLPGDAATQVKISLYLHPKVFEPFDVDIEPGLWIARNRQLVISSLESALADPQQDARIGLLIALKARLEVPYDPEKPTRALPTDALEAKYIHQVAESLSARRGETQTDAARTVLAYSVKRGDLSGADFTAARETLITHFSNVSKWTEDTLLNQYGKYLEDVRILPALREMLIKTQDDPTFRGTHAAILAQMSSLQSNEVPDHLMKEACSEQPAPLSQVRDVSSESTLPGVDSCLRSKLLAETAPSAVSVRRRDLAETLEYIARFATPALVPDVRRAYLTRTNDWDQSAQGAAVVYLMRWDAENSKPLLEPLLPGHDSSGAMWTFLLGPAYPPTEGLRSAFHAGLVSASGRDVGTYAYLLAQSGTEDDRRFITLQLKEFQMHLSVSESESDSMAEIDLIEAINHGRSWDGTREEQIAFEQSCVTVGCKQHFATDLASSLEP
jgi:hypothetical protein